jgi:hypothetical protein
MLRINVLPFTLDQPKINYLCKYVPMLMTSGVLMQKKIEKICNQNIEFWHPMKQGIQIHYFSPIWEGVVCFSEGMHFLKPWCLYPQKTWTCFTRTIALVLVIIPIFKKAISKFKFKSSFLNFLNLWLRYLKT